MDKKLTKRLDSQRSGTSDIHFNVEAAQKDNSTFGSMTLVNDMIRDVADAIFANMDTAAVNDALKGGVLTCTYDSLCGGCIEIMAIDFENLASPDESNESVKGEVEAHMSALADASLDSLGGEGIEALFNSAQIAAPGDEGFLSIHEIEDVSLFIVTRPGTMHH